MKYKFRETYNPEGIYHYLMDVLETTEPCVDRIFTKFLRYEELPEKVMQAIYKFYGGKRNAEKRRKHY